jgi:hypothetical protein
MNANDILNLSDEEFSKLSSMPEIPPTEKPEVEAPAAPEVEASPPDEPEAAPEAKKPQAAVPGSGEPKSEDPPPEEPKVEAEPKDPPPETKPPEPAKPDAFSGKPDEPKPPEPKKEEEKAPEPEKKPEPEVPAQGQDYKAFHDQIMAPFKANGKMIQLESIDEVIQLMQMGANYTKKMQSIQQHKKYLMMLENNGLLDENKLSLLIDLDKKNPEAIKKYLKDAKIDPVNVDITEEPDYKSGSHTVTDQEASLSTAIDEISAMPGGKETLQSINTWDAKSKEAIWGNPELLNTVHTQRENGIYAKISAEIERRKILGQIGPNVPFLLAYKTIGEELADKGVFQRPANPARPTQQPVTKTPVAIKPAKTSVTKAPDDRVRAAAPTRTTPNPAKQLPNYLAMSDEEFLKLKP